MLPETTRMNIITTQLKMKVSMCRWHCPLRNVILRHMQSEWEIQDIPFKSAETRSGVESPVQWARNPLSPKPINGRRSDGASPRELAHATLSEKKKKKKLHHFDAGSKPNRGEVRFVFPLSACVSMRVRYPPRTQKKKKRWTMKGSLIKILPLLTK